MQRERRRAVGWKKDSWKRSVTPPGPYWLWLIAPQHRATAIKFNTHITCQLLHGSLQLLSHSVSFIWASCQSSQKPSHVPQVFLVSASNCYTFCRCLPYSTLISFFQCTQKRSIKEKLYLKNPASSNFWKADPLLNTTRGWCLSFVTCAVHLRKLIWRHCVLFKLVCSCGAWI